MSSAARLETLLTHALNLGLRNPSEPSYQVMAALYLCQIEKQQVVGSMDAAMRLHCAQNIKAVFKRLSAAQRSPGFPFPPQLPASAVEFQRDLPSWWDLAFPSRDCPVPCRICRSELMQTTARVPMRITRVDARPMQSRHQPTAPVQLQLSTSQPAAPQQMMMAMMQQFQQLASLMCPRAPAEQPETRSTIRVLGRMQSRLALEEGTSSSVSDLPARPQPPLQQVALENIRGAEAADEAQETAETAATISHLPKIAGKMTVQESTAAMVDAMLQKKQGEAPAAKAKAKSKAKAAAKSKAIQKQTAASEKSKAVKKQAIKQKSQKNKEPTIAWERSRMQVMCRTGQGGPGSSHAVKYEKGGEDAAWVQAERWLAKERKKQKL